MSAEKELSVLARKCALSGRRRESSADFAELCAALSKAVAGALETLLDVEFRTQISIGTEPLDACLASRDDGAMLYWMTTETGQPAALLDVEPAFAVALSARLLGGELDLASQTAAPGALDRAMAGSLADILGPALDTAVARLAGKAQPGRLFANRTGPVAAKDAARDSENITAVIASVAVATIEGDFTDAFRLVFPSQVLKRAGALDARISGRAPTRPAEAWAGRLRRNLLHTEIELAVVLDRIETSVGALSRLQVGDVFELHPEALQRLDLCAATDAGPAGVATGRLGAWRARKAIKLTSPADPDFIKGL